MGTTGQFQSKERPRILLEQNNGSGDKQETVDLV